MAESTGISLGQRQGRAHRHPQSSLRGVRRRCSCRIEFCTVCSCRHSHKHNLGRLHKHPASRRFPEQSTYPIYVPTSLAACACTDHTEGKSSIACHTIPRPRRRITTHTHRAARAAAHPAAVMSSVIRSVKNVTKGYSSVQVKVRNGTTCLTLQQYSTGRY